MDIQALYEVFPGLDCGACGAPTCNAFARRILIGRSTPDDCPALRGPEYADRRARISAGMLEGVQAPHRGRDASELGGGVTYIRPCAEDVSKITAETRLQRGFAVPAQLRFEVFDPSPWDWMLSSAELFENARCSQALGVARIEAYGMTIMVFRDGRVNVRAARDEEQATAAIHFLSRTLFGSIICHCGSMLMDCAGGACTDCLRGACPASDGEPFALTDAQPRTDQDISGLSTWSGPAAGAPLQALGSSLNEAARILADMAARLIRGQTVDPACEDAGKILSEARREAVRMLARASAGRYALSALIAMGAITDLQRVSDGLIVIAHGQQPIYGASNDLLTRALHIFALSGDGLRSGRLSDVAAAQKRFEEFRDAWKTEAENRVDTPTLLALHKIAVNTLYLSRLRCPKPGEALEWLRHQSRAA